LRNNLFDKAIISDASCLIGLTNINKLQILKLLFSQIIITPEVEKEYKLPLPAWITVKDAKDKGMIAEARKNKLDLGESSSIALAIETENSVLILDDDKARSFARNKGVAITGTLTIIGHACDLGYIDSYEEACHSLKKVNFRISQKVQDEVAKKLSKNNDKSFDNHSRGKSR